MVPPTILAQVFGVQFILTLLLICSFRCDRRQGGPQASPDRGYLWFSDNFGASFWAQFIHTLLLI